MSSTNWTKRFFPNGSNLRLLQQQTQWRPKLEKRWDCSKKVQYAATQTKKAERTSASLLEEGRNTTSFTKCYFPLLTAVAYTPFIFQVTLQFCFAYLSRLHLNNARKSTLETNVASDLRRLRHCMHCMNTSFQVHGHITITHFTT